jgi:serine O-acetyltransferase
VMDNKQAEREAVAARMGFSAYGVTEGDDPLSQALRGLIDHASGHEHQIALLWDAISKLAHEAQTEAGRACLPRDAQTKEDFDAEGLNRLVK